MKSKRKKDHADFTKQVNALMREQTHRELAEEVIAYRVNASHTSNEFDELSRRLGKAHRRFTDIETIVFDILTTRVSKGKTAAKLMICPTHGVLTPDLVYEERDSDAGGVREGTYKHRIAGKTGAESVQCYHKVLNVKDPVRMFWKALIDLAKRGQTICDTTRTRFHIDWESL